MLEHLGIIGGQTHEQEQTNGAEQQITNAKAEAKQAEQAANQGADDHGDQTAHQFGAPADQAAVSGSTVHGHNAEVDSAHQEGQHQAAQIIDQEDGAEVQAVECRIGKEDASSGAWLQAGDTGGQYTDQNQLCNAGDEEDTAVDESIDQTGGNSTDGHGEGDQQTGKHPAEGLGHILI